MSESEYQLDDVEAVHIPTFEINANFLDCIDLLSSLLQTRILSSSDQFFAPASNLISPHPPISKPNTYIATGAWYDGWETRRHNAHPFDYVIFRLRVPSGIISGVEIDTAFFSGNHAPAISVEGCWCDDDELVKSWGGERGGWKTILGKKECKGHTRHAWRLLSPAKGEGKGFTHIRLNNHPDGGIARFRLYGTVLPIFPFALNEIIDLASIFNGGLAIDASDERYGKASNLLLPGRGVDISDGWETARSREKGHVDLATIKLGARGLVESVVVDTVCFIGNFPRAVRVLAMDVKDNEWFVLVGESEMGADREHEFVVEGGKVVTHVKLVMIPDGGVKRLRVFGRRVLAD